ncbi:uncharacterized protein LOC131363300 [Hemibagrus wyckioides]|uniref:uncharacterized protein LOC131363300 n=1 Tax=Hemibagrus wyckioides TaxID=337641 RepID=UPI00266C174B|nr:uncharacterized protein LOC131363300 [Hemibagrus wyckioides]
MNFSKFLPSASTFRGVACAGGLLALASAGYWAYHRLKRRSGLPAADPQPAPGAVADVEEVEDVQVTEPIQQLPPTELLPQTSAVVLFSRHSGAGDLHSARSNVRFLTSHIYGSQFQSVEVRRYFIQPWRFTVTETSCVPLGSSNSTACEESFTSVQRVSGSVKEPESCLGVETVTSVPHEDGEQTFNQGRCSHLPVSVEDQVDTSHLEEEERSLTPHADLDIESDFEESIDDLSPEESEVPFISAHLWLDGVTDVALKLPAIREAFSGMLDCMLVQNLLYLSGKKILMRLAAANKKDVDGVKRAYDSVIRFVRKPSNWEWIEAELLQAQLHHFSFLDVFFELVLFRCFIHSSPPPASDGGLLQPLFLAISQWDVEVREPEAERLFLRLSNILTVLLEDLFHQPLELYGDPAALASAVLKIVKQRVQEMMKTIERV